MVPREVKIEMDIIKEISSNYEQEILKDMTASKKAIALIRSLTEDEKTRLLEEFYAQLEQKLRSLALKQLEDSIKFIKGINAADVKISEKR